MSNIIGFSKGLYTSWFYHSPSRSLFDCGEGCASFLGNKVNAIQNIFISHDHNDHIAGLLTFLMARAAGTVAMVKDPDNPDKEIAKPLNIFYPDDKGSNVPKLRTYINLGFRNLGYIINWIPIKPTDNYLINGVKAFRTRHHSGLSLGYRIVEMRKRLRAEFKGQNIGELLRAKKVDRDSLSEIYAANALVYTLDSRVEYNSDNIFGADTWIADTTFLNVEDRTGDNTHGSLDEVLKYAAKHNVKNVLCAHISPRYEPTDISLAFVDARKRYSDLNIECVNPSGIFNY